MGSCCERGRVDVVAVSGSASGVEVLTPTGGGDDNSGICVEVATRDGANYTVDKYVEVKVGDEVIGVVVLTIVVTGDDDVTTAGSLLLAAARDEVVGVIDVVPSSSASWSTTVWSLLSSTMLLVGRAPKPIVARGLVMPVPAVEFVPSPRQACCLPLSPLSRRPPPSPSRLKKKRE